MSGKFGWCLTNQCKRCIVSGVATEIVCSCPCHEENHEDEAALSPSCRATLVVTENTEES